MTTEGFSGTVAVVGLGYIGLPTAVTLAMHGVPVVGVDVNPTTVDRVARGELPFVEPGLAISLSGVVAKGLLTAQTEIPEADVYVISVPTPITSENTADLSYVFSAAAAVAPMLRPRALVVLESTVPPGTTEAISRAFADARPDLVFPHDVDSEPDVLIAHCPERVLPGRIMTEMVTNDRVIGGLTVDSAALAADLYQVFCGGAIHLTDAASAEMAKLVENAYRDVNIAFANELSMVCERLSLDVWEVIRMANHHPRVQILEPGPGVGGHCIAVDPWYIVEAAPEEAVLIRAAREVNNNKAHHVAEKVIKSAQRFKEPVVACLGLAYKADVDDTRESPAIEVVAALAAGLESTTILASDPVVGRLPAPLDSLPGVRLENASVAIAAADIVVVLVDHQLFRRLPRRLLEGKVVHDVRNLWGR